VQQAAIKELDQFILNNELVQFYVSRNLDGLISNFRQLLYDQQSGKSVNLSSWRSWKTQLNQDKHD
jgi:hypothetical protein